MCINKNVNKNPHVLLVLGVRACSLSVMSLLSWLKKSQTTKPVVFQAPNMAGLPDPNAEDNAVDGSICESANKEIEAQIATTSKGKKKRSSYNHYEAEMQLKIAKSACHIGLTATARKFSKTLGKSIAYTTVQSIRNDYWKKLRKDVQDPLEISTLPIAKRGRPLLIGEELDSWRFVRKVDMFL